ncbi:MAG: hypothetical protein EKK34_00555 [Mycobacterium sp.]|nr:MAG: hypothetical protein EKK34_00555 [Mycobacterium sp.]
MPIEVEQVRVSRGVYAHVRQELDKDLELHRLYFGGFPYGLQGQVDDVRAGRPVKVTARWLPAGARVGAEVVIVHPNDRVQQTADNWAEHWLEENGL